MLYRLSKVTLQKLSGWCDIRLYNPLPPFAKRGVTDFLFLELLELTPPFLPAESVY